MAIIPTDRKVKSDVVDSAPLDQGKGKETQPKPEIKLNKAGDVLVNKPELDPLKEEKSRTVAMLFGRMNPPTKGHEENVEGLKKLAKEHNADHVVIASHSHDGEKNPLTPEQKLKHLQRAFPNTNVKTSSKAQPTILHHAAELHKQGYKHLIVAGGGDRAEEYKKLLHKYNGVEGRHGHYNFDSIEVKSTGERKEGVSGSDMRKHVKSGNFDKFREGLPSKIRDNESHAKELFHDVKGGLKEYYERVGRLIERFTKMYGDMIHVSELDIGTLRSYVSKAGSDIQNKSKERMKASQERHSAEIKAGTRKPGELSDGPQHKPTDKENELSNAITSRYLKTKQAERKIWVKNTTPEKMAARAAAASERSKQFSAGMRAVDATAARLAKQRDEESVREGHVPDDRGRVLTPADKQKLGKLADLMAKEKAKKVAEEVELEEAFLHDPDTYLRMATQAREQGKILRAALLTRIAAAVRRRDTATAMTLRRSLPNTQE